MPENGKIEREVGKILSRQLEGELSESEIRRLRELLKTHVEARRLYDEEVKAGGETVHMGIDVSVLKQLGLFPDKYGLETNRAAVALIVQYCHEQGLIQKVYQPEELFVQTSV